MVPEPLLSRKWSAHHFNKVRHVCPRASAHVLGSIGGTFKVECVWGAGDQSLLFRDQDGITTGAPTTDPP